MATLVDFRYHLVSLISVFFALAIGIILGAGPLQNSIGNALHGQVNNLRTANETLKAENEAQVQQLDAQAQAFEELAPGLISDTLTGRGVALVVLPGVDAQTVSSVQTRLESAGATVTGQVSVQPAWTDAGQNSFRSSFAEQIRQYVPDAPAEPAGVLNRALYTLTSGGTEANDVLAGLMTGTDSPLLSISDLTKGANAVVVLTPDAVASNDAELDADARAQLDYTASTYTDLINMLGDLGPTVSAGAANADNDITAKVRAANGKAATVDSPASVLGQINVAIATASAINGTAVHLGSQAGASANIGTRVVAAAPAEQPPAEEPAPAPEQAAEDAQTPAEGE